MNVKLFGRVVVEIFDYQGGQLGIPGPRPCLDRALVPRVSAVADVMTDRNIYRSRSHRHPCEELPPFLSLSLSLKPG